MDEEVKICPYCGQPLQRGGLIDWECWNCDLEYDEVYDSVNHEDTLLLLVPDICRECGGPYPDCRTTCPFFREDP